MDLHDVGRNRGGAATAMKRITAPVLTIGIDSDILYPAYQQQVLHGHVAGNDPRTRYVEISSPEGHDAFLIDSHAVGLEIKSFLSQL